MPNKLTQFWKELKRRNVVRVITIYAAAAFVVLQLIEILAPSLRLPEWTMNFMLVLLIVGFVIAVILSWIYDLKPEEGFVKTEQTQKEGAQEIHRPSNGWKIASYISFVVIVGLIILNVISGKNKSGTENSLPNSIAILPFQDQSPEGENQYIVNNFMTSILESLSNAEGLTVKSRSSTEQYRNKSKTPQEIGEELGVSYLIEGWGTLLENVITFDISLIVAHSGEILWSESYDRDFSVRNLNALKSDIAFHVLDGVHATITEEEEERINAP
ncbi:MAG: hypothetical protein U9R60_12315, partial [Bacteroidota bacterium]|nr:hypothetical protein [Bacteroidota bacterium]